MWPFTKTEKLLRAILTAQFRPAWFCFTLIERIDSMLVYNVTAAPPTAKDVVSRELSVAENGEPVGTTTYPPDATDLGDFSFSDNTQVAMTLVDIDDAGNRSQPAVLEFVATDTIAPSQPGGFGVTLVREE